MKYVFFILFSLLVSSTNIGSTQETKISETKTENIYQEKFMHENDYKRDYLELDKNMDAAQNNINIILKTVEINSH